jgi:hypothetical protein
MILDYNINGEENFPLTISFSYHQPFDLSLWKYTNSELIETDNKRLLKFEKFIKKLKAGDEIKLDTEVKLMTGKPSDQARVPNLIKIMIKILKVANEMGQPILMSFMHDYKSKAGSRPIYIVCLNCEKIINQLYRNDKVEITMCPDCFHKTYMLITNSLWHYKSNIEDKMKQIKESIDYD